MMNKEIMIDMALDIVDLEMYEGTEEKVEILENKWNILNDEI